MKIINNERGSGGWIICAMIAVMLVAFAPDILKWTATELKDSDLHAIIDETKEAVAEISKEFSEDTTKEQPKTQPVNTDSTIQIQSKEKTKKEIVKKATPKSGEPFCNDGEMALMIGEKIYFIGEKDSWSDIKPTKCGGVKNG